MGYIYKITNITNNKIYIGKTSRSLNIRWNEHKKESLYSDRPLYKAIRKYGLDAFKISLIEEVSEDKINEREQYWISYFDTYNNGYNCTIGGEGQPKYDYQCIIELYEQGYTCNQIAKILGCSKDTISDILRSQNIEIKTGGEIIKQRIRKPVVQLEKETNIVIATYDSIQDAARALGKDNSGSASHISEACRGIRKSAFGYRWQFVSE